MMGEMKTTMPHAADAIKLAAKSFLTKFDFNEYGGAPLLGVGGICIICHGASDWRGLKNAVRAAKVFASQHVNDRITDFLAQGQKA
jgi:glycerol-3-phosphate acyltransferase PlsX